MKKQILLAIFILTGELGNAQGWHLFVKNQLSYYQQRIDKSIKVETFLLDSSLNINGVDYLYFNAKSEISENCYSKLRKEFENIDWIKNPNKIDSLLQTGDTILFIASFSSLLDTFIFKPYCKVGDSWITNLIKIECTEVNVAHILGMQDSIKVFKCTGAAYDTIEFVLSKSYGLIKFLPFNEFIWHDVNSNFVPYFELIGFTKSDISKGYIQPDFSKYFHLSIGDILFWRDYSVQYDTFPESTTYHIDSITFVYISDDSVYYDYTRTDFNERGEVVHIGYYSSYHLRKVEGKVVENLTSWFGLYFYEYQPIRVFLIKSVFLKIENDDTITFVEYELPGLFIDTTNCYVGYMADYDLTVGFSTREGLIFQASYSWGEESTTLMGSIIKGEKYGTVEIPTILKAIKDDQIIIYPNPVIDYITINSQNQGINNIELYDITGNLILTKPYAEKLNIIQISPGIYILRLIDNSNRLINLKIIKQ
jgi:hypothetical protein